jgi:hypothetical protein
MTLRTIIFAAAAMGVVGLLVSWCGFVYLNILETEAAQSTSEDDFGVSDSA